MRWGGFVDRGVEGMYRDRRGSEMCIYNDPKQFDDGRDCMMVKSSTFRVRLSENMFKVIKRDGFVRVEDIKMRSDCIVC